MVGTLHARDQLVHALTAMFPVRVVIPSGVAGLSAPMQAPDEPADVRIPGPPDAPRQRQDSGHGIRVHRACGPNCRALGLLVAVVLLGWLLRKRNNRRIREVDQRLSQKERITVTTAGEEKS